MTTDWTTTVKGTGEYATSTTGRTSARSRLRMLIIAADTDMAPSSHYIEVFKLLHGGLFDGGWMGEGRPEGRHSLAILPGGTC